MQPHKFQGWLNSLFEQETIISNSRQTWKFGKPQKFARGGTLKKSRTKAQRIIQGKKSSDTPARHFK
jgi:hypothetical protein